MLVPPISFVKGEHSSLKLKPIKKCIWKNISSLLTKPIRPCNYWKRWKYILSGGWKRKMCVFLLVTICGCRISFHVWDWLMFIFIESLLFKTIWCNFVLLLYVLLVLGSKTISWCYIYIYRLNSSFSPPNFHEVAILAAKKKTTKPPPKFCNCSSFGPQGKKKHVAPHLGCHVSIDQVKIGLGGQYCHRCKT